MTRKGIIVPGSVPDILIRWLTDNAGFHQPMTIAKALGRETQPTANVLARMARNGIILRLHQPIPGRPTPLTLYGVDPAVSRRPKELR